MSLGSLLLKFKQKFGHGVRVAYWRDVVRPRILRTRAVVGATDRTCEIHVMTSKDDWLNLLWALKSFYWASRRHYALCIHDDGTLRSEDVATLRTHFPEARLIERKAANERLKAGLASYPRCWQFRETNLLAPKVFDFPAYLEADRMLLLDSDVLFFEEPTELLRRIEDPSYRLNCFNADVESSYTVDESVVREEGGFGLQPRINSGLALVHRESLKYEWVEEFLGYSGLLGGHFWRIEQTIYALCSSRFGVELLPDEYAVRLDAGIGASPSRHYVGAIRHWMYGEGIRRLSKSGMLRDLA